VKARRVSMEKEGTRKEQAVKARDFPERLEPV
jgi:hypothetical protein